MGTGTGGISTTIPETTKKHGCPTDNIPDNRFFKTLNCIKIMFLSHNNVFNQNQIYLKSCIYLFINSRILIKKIRHFD
jgi:hypothetical protein